LEWTLESPLANSIVHYYEKKVKEKKKENKKNSKCALTVEQVFVQIVLFSVLLSPSRTCNHQILVELTWAPDYVYLALNIVRMFGQLL